MVPVLEDAVLAKRWKSARTRILCWLFRSAPGAGYNRCDIAEEGLARIMGDVASLAWKWRKPLAARLLPAPGKGPGDHTAFSDDRMANTIVR